MAVGNNLGVSFELTLVDFSRLSRRSIDNSASARVAALKQAFCERAMHLTCHASSCLKSVSPAGYPSIGCGIVEPLFQAGPQDLQ